MVLLRCCGGGTEEEGAPVCRGWDTVCVEDGCFGGGERDEAEGVWRGERLELAHEFGTNSSDAHDGDGDGFGIFGGGGRRGHGRTGESDERKMASRNE